VAARADIDALPMEEVNDLPFRSKRPVSHMCGHDGHTTSLLGGLSKYLEILDKIPSNRGIRFLFQPGEEGAGGALKMVEDGAMEGVDEVYGFHNVPKPDLTGKILCQVGPMMAGGATVSFKIVGLGGHGSCPEKCKNPVPTGARVY